MVDGDAARDGHALGGRHARAAVARGRDARRLREPDHVEDAEEATTPIS